MGSEFNLIHFVWVYQYKRNFLVSAGQSPWGERFVDMSHTSVSRDQTVTDHRFKYRWTNMVYSG